MRVTGLVPEQEAAEAGGGQQRRTRQGCLLREGREGGRQVGSRRTCPLLLFPTRAALCHASLGLSFSICKMGGVTLALHTDWVKTSGRTLYSEDLTHTPEQCLVCKEHASQGSRSVL